MVNAVYFRGDKRKMINTKTKGELGRRIEYDVEHDLFHPQNIYSDEYITPTFVEYVQKLEKENAEAKEIIRELLTCARNYPESSKQKMQKAEAFLNSEVEK